MNIFFNHGKWPPLPLLASSRHVRLSAGIVACLCVFLISINLRHASVSREAAVESNQKALLTTAQSVAGHASVAFSLADTIARDVALELETYGTGIERVEQMRASAAVRARALSVVSNVIALDDRADVLFLLKPSGGTPAQFSSREFFLYHRDHHDRAPHISHPVRAFSDGRWVIPVSRRFDHPDGSFAGVVVAIVDQSYFTDFYQKLDLGDTDAVGLYFSDRKVVSSSYPAVVDGAQPLLDMRIAPESVSLGATPTNGRVGAIGGKDEDARLYAVAGIYLFDLTAVVTRSTASALSAWDAASRIAAQSAAATMVLLAFLLAVVVTEVRGRRAAEGTIWQKDNQFRLMIDGVQDYGIFMLDTAGRVMTWNLGAERLTGHPATKAIGSESDFFCLPEARDPAQQKRRMDQALRDGREESESWRVRADGTRFLVHATTTPLFDTEREHYGFLMVLRDITESHQTREKLQASEFRWKYALQGAGEGVWDIDMSTRYAEVSAAYMNMLGYGEISARLSAEAWVEMVHPDDLESARKAFYDHCTGLTTSYAAQYRIRCKDGSWKWVLSRGMAVQRAANGDVMRIIGTHTDIAHLKSIEERLHQQNALVMEKNAQLEQASRVKSEFLANMSHELRTPLNAVLGFTGTILMELPGPLNAEQKHQLGIVRESGRHLLDLINELLDLSKIESGTADVKRVPVDCHVLVDDVVRSLMPLATQKHIELEIVTAMEAIEIITDPRLLKQILINLVGNALKFTESGTVTVQLRHEAATAAHSDAVWIDIQDTGIGIRAEDLGKLFLPFTQIEAALSRRFEGTGLGLNVSKKYAELLGASLHVSSQYGYGSRFSICLPAAVPHPA